MHGKHVRSRTQALLIILAICTIAIALTALPSLPQAYAQEPTILVTGYTGTSLNYTLSQLQAMPDVTMYGGFYQQNQARVNSGLWTGVDLLYLCNQVGGITPTCNVTVTGQGTNIFPYNMVQNGMDINIGYRTYNNQTGAQQDQTERVYVVLAYQVNGTNLPATEQPAPRLVIVGPEGLVIAGSGGRGVTQVNITNSQPSPTPTPTETPAPTATPTITPTPTQASTPIPPSPTITPSTAPTPSVTPTATTSPTTSPSSSPTQQPTSSLSSSPEPEPNQLANTYTITAIAGGLAVIIIVAAVIILKRK